MYLELSYVIKKSDPIYPNNPPESLEPVLRQDNGDICNVSMIHHFTHNGTHLDTPFHHDPKGEKIETIPLEKFIYEHPVLLNIPKNYCEEITDGDLRKYDLQQADALLIRTGFDELRIQDPAGYSERFPGVSLDAAKYMREELLALKTVIIDFMSIEKYLEGNRQGYPVHHQLLCMSTSNQRPILIIEDANLKPLVGKDLKRVFALPMRFEGTDGVPVNVVAEVN
jgi:arylformamidase